MALLTACSDLVPEVWLAPSHLPHSDDLWTKFDLDNDRTLVLPNPSPNGCDSPLTAFLDIGGGGMHPGALPTPPHSPPTEHDLDDLVASIPEILESPSASPPSAISEILSDLEGMETASSPPRLEGSWGTVEWWGAGPITHTQHLEASIKRDIMWGGGGTCTTAHHTTTVTTTTTNTSVTAPLVEVKKERQDSESSTEAAYYRDVIHTDDLSDDSDTEDNLPDTPSCTDSDCDADDPAWPPPHYPHHHHHHHHSVSSPTTTTTTTTSAPHHASPSVSSEHNYCGRVPESHLHHHHHHILHHHQTTGTITPSDTEDEVDVVSCPEQNDITTTSSTTSRLHLPPPATTTTTTTTTTNKGSVDVKRQLQLAIQEAVRNRQNRTGTGNSSTTTTTTSTTSRSSSSCSATTTETECIGGGEAAAAARLVSTKIKTQGKPAAYTKRMRDYHSEVVKSTKHRRRNNGENDEGRRSVHNSLERQRRVDLRNAFEYLRQLVPDTKILEKAPKVQILKKAALHCKNLQNTEQRLLREKEKLRKQIEELQQRKALCS